MAELVDAPDSKFGGVTPRVGSSPTLGTIFSYLARETNVRFRPGRGKRIILKSSFTGVNSGFKMILFPRPGQNLIILPLLAFIRI